MLEAVRTSETSVDNHFTRQYIPEDNPEVIYCQIINEIGALTEIGQKVFMTDFTVLF
jgi:hypothetical protein